jgi:hypothetical protein
MLGSNRFADFFARMPSAPPSSRRVDRRPWLAEDIFGSTGVTHARRDAGRSFADCVCEQLGLHPNQYEEAVFQRCLYRKARVLRPLLQCCNRNFFTPDRDFVRRIGKIRRREELTRELEDFFYHPRNGGWLRREFNLRVSCRKIVALAREVMPELRAPGSARNDIPREDE